MNKQKSMKEVDHEFEENDGDGFEIGEDEEIPESLGMVEAND